MGRSTDRAGAVPGWSIAAAATVVVVAALLLVGGCSASWYAAASRWQFVSVAHQLGDRDDPVALSDVGPPPGVMVQDWRITLPASRIRPRLHLSPAAGSLIVHADDGVTGYDAATGARRWRYAEPGRRMWASTTGDTVVLATEVGAGFDPASDRLVGLDAGSGELLWARQLRWRLGRSSTGLTVADQVVPVLDEAGSTYRLVGLDPRTGRPAWVADQELCGLGVLDPPAASDGSVILVQDLCRGEGSWRAYDPATGRLLWLATTWPVWARHSDMHIVAGHVVAQIPGSGLQLVDPGGATDTVDQAARARSPIGFWLPVDEGSGSSLVDVRTGAAASSGWPPLVPDRAVATLAGDGTLYALDGRGPVPGLAAGDPADGPTWMPLPGSVDVLGSPVWAATAGGRLLLARELPDQPMRVFAYASRATTGPVHLAGVPTEHWPDPCQLLRMEGAVSAEAVPSAAMRLGTVEIPRQACRISLQDRDAGGLDHLEVEVIWVAASAEQARDWLAGSPGPDGVDEVVDAGSRLLARIGRVLLELRGYATDVDPLPVLASIAGQLSDS